MYLIKSLTSIHNIYNYLLLLEGLNKVYFLQFFFFLSDIVIDIFFSLYKNYIIYIIIITLSYINNLNNDIY